MGNVAYTSEPITAAPLPNRDFNKRNSGTTPEAVIMEAAQGINRLPNIPIKLKNQDQPRNPTGAMLFDWLIQLRGCNQEKNSAKGSATTTGC